jgi:uncharacterized SAM-binding protein YcdF (DUF218 family)
MTILKRSIEICFSPVGIMTLLFVAGLIVIAYRRTSRMGHRLIWGGVWLYLIFLFTPLAEVLVSNLERPFPAMLHPDASAGIRAIVVLSGYGEDSSFLPVTSKLSEETIARMVEGIRLYRELPGVKLVVSGGVLRAGERPIADLMADFAKAMGVPEGDVVIETKSETTHENLVEVKKIIGSEPFILVTSACDLRRSTAVARNLGMKPLAAPAAIWAAQNYPAGMPWLEWSRKLIEGVATPSTSRFGYLQWAYHEYVGYAWYWMLGRV